MRDEKEVLDRQQKTDIEAQKNLEENLQQLKSRLEELNSQEEEMKERLERDQAASRKHEEEMKRLKKEQEQMRKKSQESRYGICFQVLVCSLRTAIQILCFALLVLLIVTVGHFLLCPDYVALVLMGPLSFLHSGASMIL